MTAFEGDDWATLFVTNVLNGTVAAGGYVVDQGTVVRIDLKVDEDETPEVESETVTGFGFGERTDPAALVIGPTGVGLGRGGTLYVADTLANRIAVIPNALFCHRSAGTGETVSEGGAINGPLGLATAPNGNMVETTHTPGRSGRRQTRDRRRGAASLA